jgi:hypothetical protein
MHNRLFGGNGSSQGFTNVIELGLGWVLFVASQSDAPPTEELPCALSQGLEQWLRSQPAVRVRSTLPILKGGDTIGIHVWYDAERRSRILFPTALPGFAFEDLEVFEELSA